MENTNDVNNNINTEETTTEEREDTMNEKVAKGIGYRLGRGLRIVGKYLIKCAKASGKAAAVAAGGTVATIAVLKILEPKKQYIDVPGNNPPQVNAEEGVDFVSASNDGPLDE